MYRPLPFIFSSPFVSLYYHSHTHINLFNALPAVPRNGQMGDVESFLALDKLIMMMVNQHSNVSTVARTTSHMERTSDFSLRLVDYNNTCVTVIPQGMIVRKISFFHTSHTYAVYYFSYNILFSLSFLSYIFCFLDFPP